MNIVIDTTRIHHVFNYIYDYINGHLGFGLVANVVAMFI
jgi:hypothetical protein